MVGVPYVPEDYEALKERVATLEADHRNVSDKVTSLAHQVDAALETASDTDDEQDDDDDDTEAEDDEDDSWLPAGQARSCPHVLPVLGGANRSLTRSCCCVSGLCLRSPMSNRSDDDRFQAHLSVCAAAKIGDC